jgi:hypothetical protein
MADVWKKEKEGRAQRRAELLAAGQIVAAQLGNDWTCREWGQDSWDERVTLSNKSDGRQFSISTDEYAKGKATVSTWFDCGKHGVNLPSNESRPTISVSLSRGGLVLANEIKRRFMSEFDRLFTLIERLKVEAEDRFNEREGITARLAALAGYARHESDQAGYVYLKGGSYSYGQIDVSYSGSIDMKLRGLNEAEASAVLKILEGK